MPRFTRGFPLLFRQSCWKILGVQTSSLARSLLTLSFANLCPSSTDRESPILSYSRWISRTTSGWGVEMVMGQEPEHILHQRPILPISLLSQSEYAWLLV